MTMYRSFHGIFVIIAKLGMWVNDHTRIILRRMMHPIIWFEVPYAPFMAPARAELPFAAEATRHIMGIQYLFEYCGLKS